MRVRRAKETNNPRPLFHFSEDNLAGLQEDFERDLFAMLGVNQLHVELLQRIVQRRLLLILDGEHERDVPIRPGMLRDRPRLPFPPARGHGLAFDFEILQGRRTRPSNEYGR